MLLAFLAENELPKDDALELASECRFPAVNGRELFQEAINRGLSQL